MLIFKVKIDRLLILAAAYVYFYRISSPFYFYTFIDAFHSRAARFISSDADKCYHFNTLIAGDQLRPHNVERYCLM